jgi:putative ATP-binding cassette transporter
LDNARAGHRVRGSAPLRITVASLGSSINRLWRLGGGFWRQRGERQRACAASGALFVATLAHALLQLRVNLWLGDFFNALDSRVGSALIRDAAIFVLVALGLMLAAAAQIYFKMALQIGWRRWITRRLARPWLDHGHNYLLRFRGAEYDNPDYRIGEDVRLVTEGAVDFAVGLFNSFLLLAIFLGVLWELSGTPRVAIGGLEMHAPGYLVAAAVVYAGISTTLTHLLGRPFVQVSDELHAREGNFRYHLLRARENAESIALMRGEADERSNLDRVFARLATTWRSLMGLQARLTWLTTGFTVATPIVPLAIAAPQYFAGEISLGGLMQASQAFVQVQIALGFFIDHYARLSDWLAGIDRIVRLDDALLQIKRHGTAATGRRVVIKPSPDGTLRLIQLEVDNPQSVVVINDATTTIRPGEHVLVIGPAGIGKTLLLRAIAGLWPWGAGTIMVPERWRVMFLPHRPYMPIGSLRSVLAYPEPAGRFADGAVIAALGRCGLRRYCGRIDEDAQWHEIISGGEQQRLGFARLLLHRPDWVLMDGATSELDEAAELDMMSLFNRELAGTSLLSTGARPDMGSFYDRVLTLSQSPQGARLSEASHHRGNNDRGAPR